MKSATRLVWLLSLLAFGCGAGIETAKQDPTGRWRLTLTDGGVIYEFTVNSKRIEAEGRNCFVASGEVWGRRLRGFLVADDDDSPGGLRVFWIINSDGVLHGESSRVLKVDGSELVLGGDSVYENSETARLRRL